MAAAAAAMMVFVAFSVIRTGGFLVIFVMRTSSTVSGMFGFVA